MSTECLSTAGKKVVFAMTSALRKKVKHISSSGLEEQVFVAPQGRLLTLSVCEHDSDCDQLIESSLENEIRDHSRGKKLGLVAKIAGCLILGLLVGSRLTYDYSRDDMIELPEEGLDIQILARQLRLPAVPASGSQVRKGSTSVGSLSIAKQPKVAGRVVSRSVDSVKGDKDSKVYATPNKKTTMVSRPVVGVVEQIVKKYGKRSVSSKQLARTIVEVSSSLGYDPIFVAAVIKSESAFNTHARSHKGAQGLMQVMPATGAWLVKTTGISKGESSDPRHNLRLGITYLKQLEAQYNGNQLFALVAYNWGPGHVQAATGGKRRVPRECMKYAVTILRDYSNWSKGFI